jgi:hypothetical protein
MKVTKITVHAGRKIPQPNLGSYHMVELNDTWEATLGEEDDPIAATLELHQMISAAQKEVAMPFIKAGMPKAEEAAK